MLNTSLRRHIKEIPLIVEAAHETPFLPHLLYGMPFIFLFLFDMNMDRRRRYIGTLLNTCCKSFLTYRVVQQRNASKNWNMFPNPDGSIHKIREYSKDDVFGWKWSEITFIVLCG